MRPGNQSKFTLRNLFWQEVFIFFSFGDGGWRIQHPFWWNLVPNMLSSSWKRINQFGNCLYKRSSCVLSLFHSSPASWGCKTSSLLSVLIVVLVCVINKVHLCYCKGFVSHYLGSVSTPQCLTVVSGRGSVRCYSRFLSPLLFLGWDYTLELRMWL